MKDAVVAKGSPSSRAEPSPPREAFEAEVDAVVVGAGFGGLYAVHRLREAGLSVIALEAGSDVGGTWYWNRYPGARCDIPSQFYSYSWSEELRRDWKWSELHAAQPEILRYAQHVADRFDLRPFIRFDTRVLEAVFDEATVRWTVRTDCGDMIRARYAVMATGNLSQPHMPKIPGIESFTGDIYFTATWPDEPVDFSGKRVGIVGTGSSGIQAIPMLAQSAETLVVFQRTPSYAVPARNRPMSDTDRERLEGYLPRHVAGLDVGRLSAAAYTAPVPPRDEQWANYEELWRRGGAAFLGGNYPNILTDHAVNDVAADFIRNKIRETVDDPAVADDLSPKDYPYGVKRPCLETDYYATFNRPNVTLVNLRRDPIEAVTAGAVKTSSQTIELDALVFATGFDAMTGALTAIDIRGVGGVSLREAWADAPRAYLGLCVSGFPNLFALTGPGSLSVIGNVILNNEHHVEWMIDLMRHAANRGATRIEAEADAERAWMDRVSEVASRSLYMEANSWYLGANIPGKPRVFMPYVGQGYRAHCASVAADDYPGLAIT